MPEEFDIHPAPSPGCNVLMRMNQSCGRKIHPAPDHDPKQLCIMHSKDPAKDKTAFQSEIARILAEAERTNSIADFWFFVFASANYSCKIIAPACNFYEVTLAQDTNFSRTTFTQDADFSRAKFTQYANFIEAKFTQNAFFWGAEFHEYANFGGAIFAQNANFTVTTFTQTANFCATFTQEANFSSANFTQDAYFTHATFVQNVTFKNTTFTQKVDFNGATVSKSINFENAKFRHDSEASPGLVFSDVVIEHPELVKFYEVDLTQALFYNTDVSKFQFTLCAWRRRGGRNSRFMLFEEVVDLTEAEDLRLPDGNPDERNYRLIAETYQQLKRNFDAKGDFWTAGHWHYGEMEMQRLHSTWKPRWARWLKHHLSLVALYKYASAYGESYTLPLKWLAAVILVFALVYPAAGLAIHISDKDFSLNYCNYANFFLSHPDENPQGLIGVLIHGVMASLSVAGFQRELRYTPSYPLGRFLALIETLITTALGALLALAIRRQFKRS